VKKWNKAKALLKRFWTEEDGMGTVEIIIIIAVLVAIALIFKDGITKFVTDLMKKLFDDSKIEVDYGGGGGGGGG